MRLIFRFQTRMYIKFEFVPLQMSSAVCRVYAKVSPTTLALLFIIEPICIDYLAMQQEITSIRYTVVMKSSNAHIDMVFHTLSITHLTELRYVYLIGVSSC
jgi:hypothetical protein